MKKSILSSLWKWFAVIAIIGIIATNSFFNLIYKPKAHQTVNLFVTATECNVSAMQQYLENHVDATVTIYSYPKNHEYYASALKTQGNHLCDVLILPESHLPINSLEQEYAPIDCLFDYGINPENFEFYQKNGTNYAVKIWNAKEKINLLEGFAEFAEEDCYVIINIARPNAKPYSSTKKTSDNAFIALSALLKRTEN